MVRADKMAQWVKSLATNSDPLDFFPKSHPVETRN